MTSTSESDEIPNITNIRDVGKFVQILSAQTVNFNGPVSGSGTDDPILRNNFGRLLDGPDYAVFAGREGALTRVETFLASPGGILAITAPMGLGKTALLAGLIRRNPDRFAYHFFSARYDNGVWLDESFFLRSMLQQLDPAGGSRRGMDLPSLRACFLHALAGDDQSESSAPRILLIDAVDEVSSWSPMDYLVGRLQGEKHVIVSIRDTGQDWRAEYGAYADRITIVPLDAFDQDAVAAVFSATGEQAGQVIRMPGAMKTIMEKAAYKSVENGGARGPVIQGADPLHIRFIAEDANRYGYSADDLISQPSGLASYLDRWWLELRAVAGDKAIKDLFAVLSTALGPLARADLRAVIPDLFEDPDGFAADYFDREVMPKVRRMVTGNDTSGYALGHPRLGTHLSRRLTPAILHRARLSLLAHCSRWVDHGSLYAITYFPSHLAEADTSALLTLYRDIGYLEVAIRSMGIARFTGALRGLLAVGQPAEVEEDLTQCLRLFDREAHHLQSPFPLGSPDYVAQQLGLQALYSGDHGLADIVGQHLMSKPTNRMVPLWSSGRGSPTLVRSLAGHLGVVAAVAVSADGTHAVTGGWDGTARVWDLATGNSVQKLEGHSRWENGAVMAVAVTADGTRAVTASRDNTARVWDLATGATVSVMEGHSRAVEAVAVTADGTRAVTSSQDSTARVWDLATGMTVTTLDGHTGSVGAVVVTADGTRAVTASGDKTARVWDLATGVTVHVLKGHTGPVGAVVATADGTRAVTVSDDGTGRVWDLATGVTVHVLKGHTGPVGAVVATADGTRAVTVSDDGTGRVWDLATGATVHVLKGHTGPIEAVAVTPDGTRAVTASRDETGRVWDLATGATSHRLLAHTGPIRAVSITSNGTFAVTVGDDSDGRVWDLTTDTTMQTLDSHVGPVTAVAVTGDGSRAVTASMDNTARVWQLSDGNTVHILDGHVRPVTAVAVTGDGTRAVTASMDNTARVWQLSDGNTVHILDGHVRPVTAVAVTGDGTRAVTASMDNTARVWDLSNGSIEHILEGHTLGVTAVALTADGRHAVTASHDTTARVWDLATGSTVQTLSGHIWAVDGVAVTPDGKMAVTASRDYTCRVWDLATGATVHTLNGDNITAVAVTADGTRAVTGGYSRTARVWDLTTGTVMHILDGDAALERVAVTADGTRAVTAGYGRSVAIWDLVAGNNLQLVQLASDVTCVETVQDFTGTTIILGEASGAVTLLRLPFDA